MNSAIKNERSYWIRILGKYNENFQEFSESWKKVIFKSPLDVVKKLAMAAQKECSDDNDDQYSPLHVAACQEDSLVYKYIMENTTDKNPGTAKNGRERHFILLLLKLVIPIYAS